MMAPSKRQRLAERVAFKWQHVLLLHILIISGCIQVNDAQSNPNNLGRGDTYDGIPFLAIIGVVMGAVAVATLLGIFIIYVRYGGTREATAARQAEQTPLTAAPQLPVTSNPRTLGRQTSFPETPELDTSTSNLVEPFPASPQHGTLELTPVDGDACHVYEAYV
eukprot:m.27932 g.27932  ORF g.27932 m.27932 type:complete len:164 (+) comp11789_c0_seq1:164-655(+)